MGIVAVGTVFPLVFAIGAAYTERNKATKALGEIKVSAYIREVCFVQACMHTYEVKAFAVLTDSSQV
jgi:hypothetical protein